MKWASEAEREQAAVRHCFSFPRRDGRHSYAAERSPPKGFAKATALVGRHPAIAHVGFVELHARKGGAARGWTRC
jgi:hypothetical protein